MILRFYQVPSSLKLYLYLQSESIKPNFKYNEEESSRSEEYGNKKIKIPPMPTFLETGNLNCSLLKLYFKLKNVLIIFTSGNFMKDVKVSEPCTIISEPNYNYKL